MENIESLVLEHLRSIRADFGVVEDDVREIKTRLANVEMSIGQVTQHVGHVPSMLATQQVSADKVGDRIERIERRLEIHA